MLPCDLIVSFEYHTFYCCCTLHRKWTSPLGTGNETELYIELTKLCTVGAIVLRDHNNLQWRTMETWCITMGAMHDNIPCKVTMELSAFPDARAKWLSALHSDLERMTELKLHTRWKLWATVDQCDAHSVWALIHCLLCCFHQVIHHLPPPLPCHHHLG